MTLTFNFYQDGAIVAPPAIYARELLNYRRDSRHSIRNYHRRETMKLLRYFSRPMNIVRFAYHLVSKAKPEVSVLLLLGMPLVTHSFA